MQQTSNYNLNLPEGTDIVNPLVDYNPNFTAIDSAMKANADRTVGRATCIKSGATHVVTRSNTGSNIINFTATGDWNEGDTMTIDSVIVSVFLPDGSAALDGAYLINTEVFGILNGTRFTLYSNKADIPAQTAVNTPYDNTYSGLTAANVQDAIDEVNGRIPEIKTGSETVTTNNYGQAVLTGIDPATHILLSVTNSAGYYCIPAVISGAYRIVTLDNSGVGLEIITGRSTQYNYTYVDR